MIANPSMFMIGSAGRNAGKTEFACTLLRRFARRRELVGVKVTAIDQMNGECPRGGEGCGVCTSLKGVLCITDETTGPPGKDTTRMLEAGAARVLWLRCLKSHLEQGAKTLIEAMGPDAVCVCESNSLRRVLKPGVFVIVKDKKSSGFKASAEDVLQYADRVVLSDGGQFDLDLDRVELQDNKWALKEDAAAIVLAGGDSGRMGCDKSLLPVDGRPMIQHITEQLAPHFSQVIVSANDPPQYEFLELPVIPDISPDSGPLMGIFSSLLASSMDVNAVVACDIPEINLPLLRRMIAVSEGFDAVIPTRGKGIFEPLFAVYNKSIIPAMRGVLARRSRKISHVFEHVHVRYLELGETPDLTNLNTMKDYEDYIARHDISRRSI